VGFAAGFLLMQAGYFILQGKTFILQRDFRLCNPDS
jgi:hypothetical protein